MSDRESLLLCRVERESSAVSGTERERESSTVSDRGSLLLCRVERERVFYRIR